MTEQNIFSFSALQSKSNDGDAQAQFDLAYCYITVEKTLESALNWLKKSAEQGLVNAQLALGLYYYFSGIEKLDNDFFYLLRDRRPPLGLAVDPMDLAHRMKMLNEDESDEPFVVAKLAFDWFKKAAEQGLADAQYWLAHCYYDGKGIGKNVELAFEWFKKAAEQGLDYAEYELARCYYEGMGIDQNFELAREWTLKAVNQEYTKAYLLLGDLYSHGRGVEQNNEVAFDCYKKASERFSEGQYLLACCYRDGKGIEQNYELAFKWFTDAAFLGNKDAENWLANNSKLTDHTHLDAVMSLSPESRGAELILPFRLSVYINSKEYDLARKFVDKIYENTPNLDQNFKYVCITAIDQAEELDKKNQQLEEKNKQLQEAKKELEDMMSMFAHKFRSPLDAIIYNTTHENQVKLYTEAAQTMRGLLNIFSIISTDAEILKDKIKQDRQGSGRLATVFSKTLDMILLHLLSMSGAEKIQQHYMAYAKAHGQCDAQVSYKTWCEDYFELEQVLQAEWEQSFALLLNQSATLEQRLAWLEQHFFKLELIGFERADIQFKEYGVTESLLTILLNEILVNAFKYYSSASKQPVVLEWTEREGYQVLICRNPSIRSERDIIKGSNKGHVFLSTLARKTGSAFTKPMRQDDFVVEFGIPDELLISK